MELVLAYIIHNTHVAWALAGKLAQTHLSMPEMWSVSWTA